MSDEWKPIEGETPIEISLLRDRSLARDRSELNRIEAANIHKVAVKYLAARPSSSKAPFNLNWFLKLHQEMYCDVWKYAGSVRESEVNIGVKYSQVVTQLYDLELTILVWKEHNELLEQAVRIHHRAVQIHPFLGGNGRWSRMLADIWLKQHNAQPIEWPENEIGKPESAVRGEYIAAIKLADTGEIGPLVEIHRRFWQA